LFETAEARVVGISFRSPHHNRFHCMSNALLALIIKAVSPVAGSPHCYERQRQ
jgi:hypothetical protein